MASVRKEETMFNEAPDEIAVWTDEGRDDHAAGVGVLVNEDGSLRVMVEAATAAISYVALRWGQPLPEGARILGDHWERGYGDLEWRGVVPERALPWYALVHDARTGETRGSASKPARRVSHPGG